jgi:hypothetical protein
MNFDITLPYSQEIQDEATGYELSYEPVDSPPEGISEDEIVRLHNLALQGDQRGIAELKKLIVRFPSYPVLKNYLVVAYRISGKVRRGRAVEKEVYQLHPDYLFARLGEANHQLINGNPDKARELLGPRLRLADLHTEDRPIHVSEWLAYYRCVGLLYAESGEVKAAQAIINAFHNQGFDDDETELLERMLMAARMRKLKERLDKDERTQIRVKVPPLPRNAGERKYYDPQHPEMEGIYEYGLDFPEAFFAEILALPRETAIRDLVGILDTEICFGPILMREGENPSWTPIHALFLLSTMEASDAVDVALRFYGQHPDVLEYWFGEVISWEPVYGILGNDLPRVAEWMKTPDLSYEGRRMVADALSQLAMQRPEKREAILAWFADVLGFLRDSPPKDNILDTRLVSSLISCLMDLRAAELGPLVGDLAAKGYVSDFMVGSLEDVLKELSSPPEAHHKMPVLSMTKFYRKLTQPEKSAAPNFQESGLESLFGGAVSPKISAPATQPSAGRNDPCPCGSGKKFKKCCM